MPVLKAPMVSVLETGRSCDAFNVCFQFQVVPLNQGEIRFNAVHFSYATRPVFAGIDIYIPAGTTAALVGESGCGKSTIGRLLERFYDPTGGSITLDGVDISRWGLTDIARHVIGSIQSGNGSSKCFK